MLLNPAAERLFQVEEARVSTDLVEVMRYHQLVDLWRQTSQENSEHHVEIGSQHLFLQVVRILQNIAPGNTMILLHDLTQLRRLETVRRDFISNVSHELRTPLASMKAPC